jgi:putative ABC transport system substrate-binding protein
MKPRRREIVCLGLAACAWPLVPAAQLPARRIGLLMAYAENDADLQARVAAFRQELRRLGWLEGGNLRTVERWTTDNMERVRAGAVELVGMNPDVIFVGGRRAAMVLQQQTRSIPILFAGLSDPLGSGLVASLARPGGNITGFSGIELPVIGKMLELLKQLAPSIRRAALLFNPDNPVTTFFSRSFEVAAAPLALKSAVFPIHGPADIERVIKNFARQPNGGVVFPPDVTVTIHRELVTALMARHRLPAIYSDPVIVLAGGLMSYGPDRTDLFRRAAAYADRIMRGEKPGDLPVQQPTKFELVLNLKGAKMLGIQIPQSVYLQADQVIQ